MSKQRCFLLLASVLFLLTSSLAMAAESIWIEAEELDGVEGYCWPMAADPARKTTTGHWGISGPGCAAEWTQGGESGFLSIACGASDDAAVATKDIEIPAAGTYFAWVRYRDNRGSSSRFQLRLEQQGAAPWTGTYGEKPVIDDDNTIKLYWNWSFAWDVRPVDLKKGMARLSLSSIYKEADCRQIDCLVLTTNDAYRPFCKERPHNATWDALDSYRHGFLAGMEPLARRNTPVQIPPTWSPRTFNDKGFIYLWNIPSDTVKLWAGDDPNAVKVPYNIADAAARAAFEKKYAGKTDVPIFSDPRVVPTFQGVSPIMLATDATDPAKKETAQRFVQWLDANPNRLWAGLINYAPDTPATAAGRENFLKYRDRYVGGIASESLGYFNYTAQDIKTATAQAKNRRDLVEAMEKVYQKANNEKYKTIFGQELPQPFLNVIPCNSISMTELAPLCYDMGMRTMGFAPTVTPNEPTAMNVAFQRGAARQHGGLTATYRFFRFGDAITIYTDAGSTSKPGYIMDNFYDVYAGAGMTWYRMDTWYQYMAGSSMFYDEQGFDAYWSPGGGAMGNHGVQLSPKGKVIDRFLKLTAQAPERGAPVTPVAFLVDYAHGWGPCQYTPQYFNGDGERPDLTKYDDHARMMREYFSLAYYPSGPVNTQPITGTNVSFVPAVFGDIFDVIYAYPDAKKWTTIDTYPVVIVTGDIAITQAEGKRLADYMQKGGTLFVTDAQLTGPGVAELKLPKLGNLEETTGYRWMGAVDLQPSQCFRFRPITGGKVLAATADGKTVCAYFDQGKGRLVVLSVPRGLGIDGQAVPLVARLFAGLTRGLMPVEVEGDVEWMVNKLQNGWAVTLLNPAGDNKPQHGILPTDFRESRTVVIRARVPITAASDRLQPGEQMEVIDNALTILIPAGGVRIIELK